MSAVQEIIKANTAIEPVRSSPITPMAMIASAIERGMPIETIDKLMTLQERWEASQGRKAFDGAIALAKAEIKPIFKNRKVDFTSAKGRTNYEYEDLAEIARSVDPILGLHGLSYRFRSKQNGRELTITCILSHRDGYFEENELTASNDETGNKNSIQAIGSTATFLQRYTLKLALGLAATKDDDGAASASGGDKITDAQVDELLELAESVGADKRRFCEFYKIDSFADIPKGQFEKAKAAIEAKRVKA